MHATAQPSETDFRCALKCIYSETANYLARLARAAAEGRGVDEANNFLRWLQFSGVLRLLEMYCSVDRDFLKLRATCGQLQEICKPHLQGRNFQASPSQARIDEVNGKVDAILYLLSSRAKPIVEAVAPRASAALPPSLVIY